MAKNTPKTKGKEETITLLEKPEPPFFKVGRYAALQLSKVERNLFTDLEEKESGNYIISGLGKKISELDFTAFTFAVGQILYNQSYKYGNEDINSGFKREMDEATEETGETLYLGNIVASLNEICQLGYGVEKPTTEHKKRLSAVIDTLDKNPVVITFPNTGDKLESKLCSFINRYTRAKDGAILYHLILNPIFGSNIQKQFGELPQNVIASIEKSCRRKKQRKQAAHYLLLRWLSVQDKRVTHKLFIGTLVQELRMEIYYKKNKGMAERQILSMCDTMIDIGILNQYEVEYTQRGNRKSINSITFHLNKDYTRTTKVEKGVSSLLSWFATLDLTKPLTLPLGTLIHKIGMEEEYKYKKTRPIAVGQLLSVCDSMIDRGILNYYEVNNKKVGKSEVIDSITFHQSQSYTGTEPGNKANS